MYISTVHQCLNASVYHSGNPVIVNAEAPVLFANKRGHHGITQKQRIVQLEKHFKESYQSQAFSMSLILENVVAEGTLNHI